MKYKTEYEEFRRKPLEPKKMSIKKLRRKIKKAPGISEVSDVIENFLTQFSKLELRWIFTGIKYKLDKKYDIGII